MKKLSSVAAVITVLLVSIFLYNSPVTASTESRKPYNGRCLKSISVGILKGEFEIELGNRIKCKSSESGTCDAGTCE